MTKMVGYPLDKLARFELFTHLTGCIKLTINYLRRYYIFCAVQVLCVDGIDEVPPPHRPQSPFCILIGRWTVNHRQ